MELKQQLIKSGSNGGWVTSKRSQSIGINRQIQNDLKFSLNILAEENFDLTLNKIVDICSANIPEFVDIFLNLILLKAEFENKYHQIYSRLCAELTLK
jgi:hypothetical protein